MTQGDEKIRFRAGSKVTAVRHFERRKVVKHKIISKKSREALFFPSDKKGRSFDADI